MVNPRIFILILFSCLLFLYFTFISNIEVLHTTNNRLLYPNYYHIYVVQLNCAKFGDYKVLFS